MSQVGPRRHAPTAYWRGPAAHVSCSPVVMRIGWRLGLLACALVWLVPRSASAAAQPRCVPAQILPSASVVPVNLPGFGYTALKGTVSDVHLWATTGGSRTEIPLTLEHVDGLLKLSPTTPLVAGSTYELEYAPYCYGTVTNPGPYKFTATASAPLPTKLGAVSGTPTVVTKDFGTTQFTIDARYALDPAMKPWASVYQLLVLLDGRLVGTKATLAGDAVDIRAVGWCDAANAASRTHALTLRARLPFAPTLDTDATALTFDCPAPVLHAPVGAAPPGTGGAGGTTTNPTPVNPSGGGTTIGDAGTGSTGGSSRDSSCAASPVRPSTPPGAIVAAVLAVMAAGLRRRRAGVAAAPRT